MSDLSLEVLVSIVLLLGLAIERFVELVFKPLLLDAGVRLPDNLRKPIIFLFLIALGALLSFGFDLSFIDQYTPGLSPFVAALLSATGYAGIASGSHDILYRFRATDKKDLLTVVRSIEELLVFLKENPPETTFALFGQEEDPQAKG